METLEMASADDFIKILITDNFYTKFSNHNSQKGFCKSVFVGKEDCLV